MNDKVIKTGKNENNNERGLHIVVINPLNGKVLKAKVFDTYTDCKSLDTFIKKEVKNGQIIVAACKDECTLKLSDTAKDWFYQMGSREIKFLGYR